MPIRLSPGDLIQSSLVNSILNRLDALESTAPLALGPLATGIHTLVALGSGFEGTGGIWLDGNPILPRISRGINLAILGSQDLSLKYSNSYDTFASTFDSSRLVEDLQKWTSHYDIVAVVTIDAYVASLTDQAKNALAAVGGAALAEPASPNVPASRANAAFIGVVPGITSNVGFNYLVSVMPADGPGFPAPQSASLAALPFAWGLYSIPLRRFLIGGAANNSDTTGAVPVPQSSGGGGIGIIVETPAVAVVSRVNPADPVTRIPSIGRAEHEILANNNITNVGELANINPVHLATILNTQPDEAERIVSDARALIGR